MSLFPGKGGDALGGLAVVTGSFAFVLYYQITAAWQNIQHCKLGGISR